MSMKEFRQALNDLEAKGLLRKVIPLGASHGAKVEIDEPTLIINFKGGERIEDIVPKFEVLTSHVARKTFITNALEKGMKAEVVMEISGHKDYKIFKRYVKIANEHKKKEMLKAFK